MQQLEHEESFYNEKVAELSKEFADAIRFWLASISTAVEAPEVHLRPVGRSPGFLPYCEKSGMAQNSKFKNSISTIFTDVVDSFTSNILYGLM